MVSENITLCSRRIAERNLKIAFVESATSGRLASEFALTPFSGQILLGGIVCYDACTKQELFDIPEEIIKSFTPESAEVTRLLAERLIKFFKCDIAVAVTGLTTEGGSETDDKPVGTMFIHIKLPEDKYISHREVFEGLAPDIIKQTIERAGELLSEIMEKQEVEPVDEPEYYEPSPITDVNLPS
ncbi:nicotinamide-nucleotide amidohydrolase family protein [Flavobacterium sp. Sd200]|uniref:CinA family protein n=1 Tax=Flavobacterium sp. Sd200 TaxID=2692211 RepID=UPI001370AA55|nr:CinA family protein [Flavobacterium sp. Sd200]MXN91524.1 nicotinamide-nucleotide amidohydrolase family protein [Flavobacterium sp. Sd200]